MLNLRSRIAVLVVFTSLGSALAATPNFTAAGVLNAASFQPGVVPGGLISIFGNGFTERSGGLLPQGATIYEGTSVSIAGVLAPILLLSANQLNLQAPFDLLPGSFITVEVNNNGSRFAVSGVPVYESQPGIFEIHLGGRRVPAIVNRGGGIVGLNGDGPSRGEILSLFLTGVGPIAPMVPTGGLGPVPPAEAVLPVVVGIADVGMPVLFAGYAPGFIGLYQINFEVAAGAPSGERLKFNVKVGSTFSQDTTITVY